MPWLVMYCNNGDISILDILEHKKAESKTTGILDFFVPLDVTRLVVEGKSSLGQPEKTYFDFVRNRLSMQLCASYIQQRLPQDASIYPTKRC